ncbi:MAG: enoyl-CoA hydratase-related protein [Flavobacteriales bacterium]|nr:enoyl-CoA hydratase-related protein [Flavobacteriales bacterium]
MENILIEIKNKVGKITLNRPESFNSFTLEMAREVQTALDEFAVNDEVRAIILTGNGKAFCAGQDLKEATNSGHSIEYMVENTYNPIIRKIRNIEKPVVAAVNGVAAGAGANIAIACDITFASKTVSFIQSFSNISLIPDSAGTFFLPRLIGMQRASATMFLADKISADQAKEIGMIYEVVEPEKLTETVEQFAEALADRPTKGIGLTKRALNQSFTNSLEEQLDLEKEIQALAGKSSDHKEGVQAFLEKRKPNFVGK